VYPRRVFRTSRRRRASHDPGRRLALVLAGISVPVLVAGYALMAAHSQKAVNTASVSYPAAAGPDAGGWGRGGYEMMPGPAGSASSASGPGSSGPGSSGQGAVANAANAGATSENWAGYTSAGGAGTFTSVSASWAQPAVTCTATNTFSSFWVGLDGDGTNSVEQTGTEADCNGGAAAYQGWFEMSPPPRCSSTTPSSPGTR
jgi:Peptidase A4 family